MLFDTGEDIENDATSLDKNDNKRTKGLDTKNEKKKKPEKKEKKIKVIEENKVEWEIKYALKEILTFKTLGERLLNQFKMGKLHHATMLSGDYGIGKATFAYWMISKFLENTCEGLPEEKQEGFKKMHLELLEKNIHPDVFFLTKKDKENEIKVEQVRELINKISFRPMYGNKFVIVDDINSVNTNGVNALLKTLEEPPSNTYFFLINHRSRRLLDTIYSRCNEIKMSMSKIDCSAVLKDGVSDDVGMENEKIFFDDEEVEFYTNLSGNSIGFAVMLKKFDAFSLLSSCAELDVAEKLNIFYKAIEENYKTLPNSIKMLFLEKMLIYFTKNQFINSDNNEKNSDIGSLVLKSNSIIKQFLDIKRFELPVVFY